MQVPIEKKLKQSYLNFEEALKDLSKKAEVGPISVKSFLETIDGRGKLLLLICLSVSSCQKIPFTGFLFGPIITYFGLRIAFKNHFSLIPKTFLHKRIPSRFLVKMVSSILLFLRWIRRWSHPRNFLSEGHNSIQVINGLMICLTGVSLTISPPVPLCGLIAFAAIFSIAIGLLNEDDMYIILGYVLTTLYFIVALFLLKFFSVNKIVDLFHKVFS